MNKSASALLSRRPVTAEHDGVIVTRVGVNLGAEISGIDLCQPLSDKVFAAVQDALDTFEKASCWGEGPREKRERKEKKTVGPPPQDRPKQLELGARVAKLLAGRDFGDVVVILSRQFSLLFNTTRLSRG
jgi:hypothetical protein